MHSQENNFDFRNWREDMAETSRAGRTYGSWTVWGNQGALAKLRGLESKQLDREKSPTTTLSIGMESLGDSGSGSVEEQGQSAAGNLKKTLPWNQFDKPSAPLNIGGPKRKRDFFRQESSDLDEQDLVLALGSSPSGNKQSGLSMGLGLGQADSVGSGSGSLTSAESEMQLGLKRFSFQSQESSLRLGLARSSEEETAECGFFLGLGNRPLVDEGSSSARWRTSGGVMPSLLQSSSQASAPSSVPDLGFTEEASENDDEDLEMDLAGGEFSEKAPKICKFAGCDKGARGASGLCIAHGGGRRCQKHGCRKGAEGRTAYCKAHGGGRRCQSLGCTKSAEGKTDFCIGHGGGRRCLQEGCGKAARGRSGLCIRHGGGKRCQAEGCTKSAEGFSGLCISHGGGRRCQALGCTKGAQGSTMFCKAHGGGKRCMVEGCGKGAEGSTPLCKGHGGGKRCSFEGGGICPKSVHGGTLFCVAHGGGKRCAIPDCSKSARGKTAHCVKHGGGKRCKMEGCGKSAQGSTDFCKAHGGGKRCTWGQEGSIYGPPRGGVDKDCEVVTCDRFARGKLGLCAAHSSLVQEDKVGLAPGLFTGLVSQSSTVTSGSATQFSSGDSRFLQEAAIGQAQALMQTKDSAAAGADESSSFVSEGRVHGGGLLALLQRGSSNS